MDHSSYHDQRRALFFRRWLYWVLITILVLCLMGLGFHVMSWLTV